MGRGEREGERKKERGKRRREEGRRRGRTRERGRGRLTVQCAPPLQCLSEVETYCESHGSPTSLPVGSVGCPPNRSAGQEKGTSQQMYIGTYVHRPHTCMHAHRCTHKRTHTHTHLFLSPLPQRYNVLVQLEGLSTACLTSEAVVEVLGSTTREGEGEDTMHLNSHGCHMVWHSTSIECCVTDSTSTEVASQKGGSNSVGCITHSLTMVAMSLDVGRRSITTTLQSMSASYTNSKW